MSDELYMHRCLQLALLGREAVAPNPVVGAVLVHDHRIIGEGYHQQYGQPHAEVNCLQSVAEQDLQMISQSTLYVSLEPCAHHGKTPPCADLIIKHRIPKVVVGCRDPFTEVNGKGIEKLKEAGIEVITGVLEKECIAINKRFFTFHTKYRPYITLKWAETENGKIANKDYSRLHISNEYSNRLVHKWRSEEVAILVGTNTALHDDPELTTRLWKGRSPIRLVLDRNLRLPSHLKLLQPEQTTIVFNLHKHTLPDVKNVRNLSGVQYYQVSEEQGLVKQLVNALYQVNIQSVLVEGGGQLLQSFIDERLWDEARVITNTKMFAGNGINSPSLPTLFRNEEMLEQDRIRYFFNENN